MLRPLFCRVLLPLVIVCWAGAGTARAWGEKGHVIVAAVAEFHLNQKAKAGIRALLGDRPISSTRLANWADLIKRSSAYQKKYPKNSSFHFVDVPYQEEGFDKARDSNDGNNVIEAIDRFRKVLASSEDAEDRKDALLFLVHLVGDLHQPLHCADREKDRGGNLLKVIFVEDRSRGLNLHRVWDTNLVNEAMGDLEPLDYARRIDAAVTAKQKADWQKGNTVDWANATHKLAVERAYRKGDGGTPLPRDGPVELDQKYADTNKLVVREQLQKAGIRLAFVLNEAFE